MGALPQNLSQPGTVTQGFEMALLAEQRHYGKQNIGLA